MADDEPLRAHLLGDPGDREAVEAVAPDSPLPPPRRHRVRRRLGRMGRVEGGVEDGDLGGRPETPSAPARSPPAPGGAEAVRARAENLDRAQDVVVELDRVAEALAAVNDSVSDPLEPFRRHGFERLDRATAPSLSSTRWSLRLVEPALTTRTAVVPCYVCETLSRRAGLHEPRLVGDDDGLHTVAQAQLLEDPRHVGLHRRLAEEELLRDLGVRAPAREQAQDVDLARSQLAELGRQRGRSCAAACGRTPRSRAS